MKKALASVAAAAGLMIVVPVAPAQAMETPNADRFNGTTICGSYSDRGRGYGYSQEHNIPISSAGWGRLLQNDRGGFRVQDTAWSKVKGQLGSVFPIHNYSSISSQTVKNTNGTTYQLRINNGLNTAMNNLTCGSTFYLGVPKSQQSATTAKHSTWPSPGRFQVIQVRSNGVSFVGTEGVMKGAVMNFRIVAGASRTFLNVHTTGPSLPWGAQSAERWFMETQASGTWAAFASRIGAAQ